MNTEKNVFADYQIADMADEDIKNICDLEKTISSKTHEDIVLIAYKHNQNETLK